jgi:hypothetical protein
MTDYAEEHQEATADLAAPRAWSISEDPVLATLARLEESQKELREQISAVTETLERLSHDQALLVDALGNLRKGVLARLDRPQTAGTPAPHRMEEDHKAILEELSRLPAGLMARVDEVVGLLHRRLIALEEQIRREQRP